MLSDMRLKDFLDELASSSPAPGGGSVAALSGSLSAALSSMVCHLTIKKKKYEDVRDEMRQILTKCESLRNELTELIDEDTKAFNQVMDAFKMPKDNDEQREQRKRSIQLALKNATHSPLKIAQLCYDILNSNIVIAEKGNVNSITDTGVSALLANTGIESAALNVRINLSSIKDEGFIEKTEKELKEIEENAEELTNKIMKIVKAKM
jgi:formiminotetrahydrofolate cyclodeaminase